MSYTYSSYGEVISIKDNQGNEITDPTNIGLINSYLYRGYRYDRETGLYYLQSRYYSYEFGRFLNADGLLQDSEAGLLGHNMYLYGANNPVNNVDPNGNEIITISAVLELIASAASKVLAGTAIVATATGVIATISKVISKVTAKQKVKIAPKLPKSNKNNTVYTLKDKNGVVQYVGRTGNYERRIQQHLAPKSPRKNLVPDMKVPNLTNIQARGLEQLLIERYLTLNRGNPINNQINGIRWDNPNYMRYIEAAISIPLPDKETYVGP